MQPDYTLLMFDWDDSVALVQGIRAASPEQALRMAEVMNLSRPNLAGYQLWRGGERIAATFPVTRAHMRPRLRAIA